LQPDPTRPDALTWITSHDMIYSVPGVPLFDLKKIGRSGSDPAQVVQLVQCRPAVAQLPPEPEQGVMAGGCGVSRTACQ
jgi:hypothetical protein